MLTALKNSQLSRFNTTLRGHLNSNLISNQSHASTRYYPTPRTPNLKTPHILLPNSMTLLHRFTPNSPNPMLRPTSIIPEQRHTAARIQVLERVPARTTGGHVGAASARAPACGFARGPCAPLVVVQVEVPVWGTLWMGMGMGTGRWCGCYSAWDAGEEEAGY